MQNTQIYEVEARFAALYSVFGEAEKRGTARMDAATAGSTGGSEVSNTEFLYMVLSTYLHHTVYLSKRSHHEFK